MLRVRVVIDGGTWANRRGYGRFTRELVRALALHGRHTYTLVVDHSVDPSTLPAGVHVRTAHPGTSPSVAASADGWRSPLDMWRVSQALSSEPGDLVFFPSVYTFVPVVTRRPVVTGVHDTIAERYPELIFPNARARLFWTLKVQAALRQSSRIVAVSEYAGRCVREQFGLPASRVRTLLEAPAEVFQPVSDRPAIDAAFRALQLDPAAPTLVYVGGLGPHKNLERVLRAFVRVVHSGTVPGATLVLVGHHSADVFHAVDAPLRRIAEQLPAGRLVFAGGVPDDQLVLLLNGARALVLASLDEGFGLPAVEAAACGTPVIATRNSAVPEVLGDAALYVDPLDEASIHDALHRALSDDALRAQMGAVAATRAHALTWASTASTLERVFDELEPTAGSRA